tara:strand:- start:981 stop:1736 length:756 start_codon:yes stop_codon:yes gene_type:complete
MLELNVWIYSIISVLLVSIISIIGVVFFSVRIKTLKKVMIYMVSFSAGALFGDVFIHLLPEIAEEVGFGLNISIYVLVGIIFSFIVEKIIHWRHCHHPHDEEHNHTLATMNIFGDFVHNFIDGIIIGVSYLVSIPVGIATTVAVVLHEIPQEIGEFGVLIHSGYTRKKALFFNFIVSLSAVIGVIASLILNNSMEGVTTFMIPFAAGSFIYIAGSDLIPELHKEVELKKSIYQLISFVLGIGIMILLLLLE